MTLHVVQYSGGIGSWAAAQRVAATHGTANLVLLFADVLTEDDDLYRFLDDSTHQLGVPLTRVVDGRTPWQVFADVRYLGNSRVAPCTLHLKIRPCRRWLETHADPHDTIIYIGLDASARDRGRAAGIAAGWAPWTVQFPLLDEPHLTKDELLDWARNLGVRPPRLYELGFGHNNCGGACVRAGKGHWARLLEALPDRYAAAEQHEERLRAELGDVAILTEQRARVRHRLPLAALRERLAGGDRR
jgi:3'-phosphoadenosine 5'-phosphosulfate sulfotransferase (PAPS reductase)/FAD synthetase